MEDARPGIYHRSVQSGKWYAVSIISQRLISLASFFVLARLLLPEDYGVMSVVFLITSVFNQLTSPTFGDALVQKKEEIDHYLDIYWTFELVRNAALAIAIYLFGRFLAGFFHAPEAFTSIIALCGLVLFIPALSNPRQVYFFRE
ncbi:MAG TPA: oligosaccharide flippase family protein, partial [Patescibacteria group bacterium]|nr:oligosaccharide flippase family protein [Patescibacteria group bacterium]